MWSVAVENLSMQVDIPSSLDHNRARVRLKTTYNIRITRMIQQANSRIDRRCESNLITIIRRIFTVVISIILKLGDRMSVTNRLK